MKKKRNDKSDNLLEYIPVKNKKIGFEVNEDGAVKLIIYRNSIYDKIARKLFNTPKETVVDLDEQGSNVWNNIDGSKNIYQIIELQKQKFGEKAEPVVNRIVTYINILKNNDFISVKKVG